MTIYLRRLWKTTKVKELLNIRVNEHSKHNYFVSPLAWRLTRNSLPFLNGFYRTFIITKKVKCFYCKANYFYSVSQQQLQNFNEKFNLSLTGKLPLFLCLDLLDLPYVPPPLGVFPKSAPKIYPNPSPPEFPKFLYTPGNIAISYWSEQRSTCSFVR